MEKQTLVEDTVTPSTVQVSRSFTRVVLSLMKSRFTGFGLVGMCVMAFGVGLLYALVHFLGVDPNIAYFTQAALSVQINFFLNKYLNWPDRKGNFFTQWGKFNTSKIAVFVFNQLLFSGLVVLGIHYLIATVIGTFITTVLSYLLNDKLVFTVETTKVTQDEEKTLPGTSIIIPTYNEEEGIQQFLEKLHRQLIDTVENFFEIVVVDDSTDETPRRIRSLIDEGYGSIHLIHREGKEQTGLATAVLEGLKLSQGTYCIVMDADGQHPSELIPTMIQLAHEGADLVMPTRYDKQGKATGLTGSFRVLVSAGVRWIPRILFWKKLGRISDPLGGFFLVRKSRVHFKKIKPTGWKIALEVLLFASVERVEQIPYTFRKREAGTSKASLKVGFAFFAHLASLLIRYYIL